MANIHTKLQSGFYETRLSLGLDEMHALHDALKANEPTSDVLTKIRDQIDKWLQDHEHCVSGPAVSDKWTEENHGNCTVS